MMAVNWLDLPENIVFHIATKLTYAKDYVRFGAVCHPWRAIYTENQHKIPRQLPFLMLPTELNVDSQKRSLYSITDKRVVNFQAPVPQNFHCRGSSYGWLVAVDPKPKYRVCLFNPFLSSNNYVRLPPLTAFELDEAEHYFESFDFVTKAVLSANPTSNPDYVIMAIYGGSRRLAYFKPGAKAWKTVPSNPMRDVIHYKDKFYGLEISGQIVAWDMNHPSSRVSAVGPPLKLRAMSRYLVESSGHLLQVLRLSGERESKEIGFHNCFEVYILDLVGNQWIRNDNLRGHILFLGDNSSLSLLASDFPECKPNSIYFTDDNSVYYKIGRGVRHFGHHAMGTFNLDARSVETHYPKVPSRFTPVPIWVEPMI